MNIFKNYKILKNQGQLSILVLFSFVIISILLVAIQPEPEANVNKPVPVVVDVAKLKMQNISPIVDYTGRLEPSKKAELKFEINGRLAKKIVQPGEFVKSGKVILILEEYYIYKKLYELAKRNYELQTKEVERMSILDKKSLLSKSQYDKTLQKKIELEVAMYRSKQDFQKTFIKAKFSGVINKININEGDTVSPNMIVANLIDASSLDLYVEVRGDVIDGLKLNMNIEVVSSNRKSIGKLIAFQTSPSLETYTHLLRIRIKDNNLRSGMLASAKFILPKINKSFGVPVSSVLSDNGKKFIFIVNNKKLEKKEINVLTRFDEIYVINGDIKSNDVIVTKDVSSLSAGQDILISKK
ncbi:MAG: efflux RND transporter periplasmic adaptor subunit [Gammaproteobacteria bacterium]|nr:efflux RND transporter periplasmic adaptor subunit [Gammaproteobacteria bacterium]MBT6755433.1 efflux RND transporter periplasmic adaptor subunit [Gammaproteobacteria bacterium]MBT7523042.1 efflux RND transporter periplasmic adaptor subunit [Gammaproteobacteria bacterium]MDA9896327.1 efflux RND transporter periplasmic adaptor subunit [Gammaproteobacteria bacterium]MDC3386207.1 efflux RND transporter periplasmic adaptor subunit [Gammaproteobacteria bacterium]